MLHVFARERFLSLLAELQGFNLVLNRDDLSDKLYIEDY